MRRIRIIGLLVVLLIGVALEFGVGAQSVVLAAGSARTAAFGIIAGTVVNGTQGNTPVAHQKVTLQFNVGTKPTDVETATTDAQGRFAFTNVPPTGDNQNYAVYTAYQGGLYSSQPISLAAGAAAQAAVTVYDATQSSANLSVSIATILFSEPTQEQGLMHVGEFLTINNSGKTAFVGALPAGSSGGGGMPQGLLRFSLPANAANLTTGVGFFNSTIIQVNTGFASTASAPPGQTQFAFTFDVPYTGQTFSFPYTAEYPTTQVVALVPPNMLVQSSPGLGAQGIVDAFGSRYQVFTHNNAAAQTQMAINLWDLPTPGQKQYLNMTQLQLVVAILALVVLLLLGAYLWRGDLAVALGFVPARAVAMTRQREAFAAKAARRQDITQREADRKRLLQRLLALEKAHTSGALTDSEYSLKESQTRTDLKALLAADLPLTTASATQSQLATPKRAQPQAASKRARAVGATDVQPEQTKHAEKSADTVGAAGGNAMGGQR
ncbi:MAG: hypothetical protein ABI068_16275 [Ktedonobacterales bacterium]